MSQQAEKHFYTEKKMILLLFIVFSIEQTKSEGKLLEKLSLKFGKFGKLISAIIQKSWPKDRQGNYCDDEDVILQHLLSWTAAKNIFQLYGIFT